MKNPIYKKWFLATAVLVVLLANGPGLAATNAHMVAIAANCSPPAISADQVVVLTGTVLVTLTDQVDNAVTNEVTIRVVTGFEVTLDANTTTPANNLRTENGVAIVTKLNRSFQERNHENSIACSNSPHNLSRPETSPRP